MFHILKVAVGREFVVAEYIRNMAISRSLDIKSIFFTREVKGYVFVEGNLEQLFDILKEIPPVRGVVQSITINELEKYMKVKKETVEIKVGDIVEIIGGPFKGEKGRVSKVDTVKKEVVISLLEVPTPLPLTLSFELVRIVERAQPAL
ncbi:MAG: transcription elongation factor Spt5 [Candidatus Aenigmarchaeota archaeon]|nr:transcription elongation factor Spt5 [Candidatus Aenigmarchaeota archaeon]MDW8149436.1 transcription elongation factor Spt5 [Candidatus Aenigmarchaeota archaeon]